MGRTPGSVSRSNVTNGDATARRRTRYRIPFVEPEPLDEVPGRVGIEARIVDAARRLLIQYSSARLSMNDVAELAGVSRGTVYNYFPDRGTLILAVETAAADALCMAIDSAMAGCTGLDRQVAAATLCLVTWNDAVSATGMLTEADRAKALARPDFVLKLLMDVFRKYIEAARASGEVRRDLNIDHAAEWVARIVASFVVLPSHSFRMDRPREVSEFVATHVVRGLT